MKKLLEFILENITGSKDFSIEEVEEDGRILLTVSAKPELMGMIIGKSGKTIRNIRTLVKTRAVVDKKSVNVAVTEV